jgi:hypothetical protein
MKDAISKLTASKDLIGAVRCGMRDEVIAILDKDVRVIIIYLGIA